MSENIPLTHEIKRISLADSRIDHKDLIEESLRLIINND